MLFIICVLESKEDHWHWQWSQKVQQWVCFQQNLLEAKADLAPLFPRKVCRCGYMLRRSAFITWTEFDAVCGGGEEYSGLGSASRTGLRVQRTRVRPTSFLAMETPFSSRSICCSKPSKVQGEISHPGSEVLSCLI